MACACIAVQYIGVHCLLLGCICRWNEISEQALFYARTQTFARLEKDKVCSSYLLADKKLKVQLFHLMSVGPSLDLCSARWLSIPSWQ